MAASFLGAALAPLATHAAAPNGSLIKGQTSSSVYFLADGKRYSFPNEAVYKSWYADFSGVVTVADSELASYMLGGNVTYRPGIRLVKVATDPKVYAVSRYGVLRWVMTEQAAAALYGSDWNKKVDDVADTFFTNYLVGASISGITDFNLSNELAISSFAQDIRPSGFVPPSSPTAPTPGVNGTMVSVSISSSQATLNQMLLVFARVTGDASPITKLEIYASGQASPLTTCLNSTTCSFMYTVSQTPLQMRFRAVATDAAGTTVESPFELQATLNAAVTSSDIKIDVTPLTLSAGSRGSFNSDATKYQNITSHKVYAVIPGEPNPVLWKDCQNATICAGSSPFYRTTQLYSQVVTGGQTIGSAAVTLTVSGGVAPKPSLALTSRPSPNQVVLQLTAPSGETIGWSTIVEGTTSDDYALALCEFSSCEITVQLSKPTSFTGFTDVGGKLEASNTINAAP